MKPIASPANPSFRRWLRAAQAPRAARALGITLAEGVHLAQAAVSAAAPIEAVLVRQEARGDELERTLAAIAPGVPRYALAPALYDRLAPVEHGVGLCLVLLVPSASTAPLAGDRIYLDGVQDPGNVGAILRTAAAAGVAHVLASPGTAALWSPKVLRAAMGAHFRLDLREQLDAAPALAADGATWVAAVAHEAPSLWDCDLPAGPIGWLFGAEGAGPCAAALAACSLRVAIPTSGAVESLNVAAAAAICLFERRRRGGVAPGGARRAGPTGPAVRDSRR